MPFEHVWLQSGWQKRKMQIVIGLLTNSAGRPIVVEVFEGNTSDQTTVMKRIDTMQTDFRINEMIFIGDCGMVTKARRSDLNAEQYSGIGATQQFILIMNRVSCKSMAEPDSECKVCRCENCS